jgi:hypothetical protein
MTCHNCGKDVQRGRKYCSRLCSQLGHRRTDYGACERCGNPRRRGQVQFCSKQCASRRPRSAAPRSKPCIVCGKVFTRRYPCQVARMAHCSKRCEGHTHRHHFAEKRLPMLKAKYGALSVRERELFGWGYKLGYTRGAQTEKRRVLRAA